MHRFLLGNRPNHPAAFDFHLVVAYHLFDVFEVELLGRHVDLENLVFELKSQVVLDNWVDNRVVRNLKAEIILRVVGTVLVAVIKQEFLLRGLDRFLVG